MGRVKLCEYTDKSVVFSYFLEGIERKHEVHYIDITTQVLSPEDRIMRGGSEIEFSRVIVMSEQIPAEIKRRFPALECNRVLSFGFETRQNGEGRDFETVHGPCIVV
jgi:hypothetical protein